MTTCLNALLFGQKLTETTSRSTLRIHKGCKNCEFKSAINESYESGFHECMTQFTKLPRDEIDKGTILDIWRYRKKEELIEAGIFKIADAKNYIDVKLSDEGLSHTERQMLQIAGIPADEDKGGFYFDADYFRSLQSKWTYPFHFIDFETCTVALPFFKGMRPYESIAFQFSHHVMHENGEVEHRNQALIAEPGQFPNFEFVKRVTKISGYRQWDNLSVGCTRKHNTKSNQATALDL